MLDTPFSFCQWDVSLKEWLLNNRLKAKQLRELRNTQSDIEETYLLQTPQKPKRSEMTNERRERQRKNRCSESKWGTWIRYMNKWKLKMVSWRSSRNVTCPRDLLSSTKQESASYTKANKTSIRRPNYSAALAHSQRFQSTVWCERSKGCHGGEFYCGLFQAYSASICSEMHT